MRTVPPLFDARLLATEGERWLLTGLEIILDGPLGDERAYSQTWIIEPAPIDDLIAAERRVNALSGELNDLRAELAALRKAPDSGAKPAT